MSARTCFIVMPFRGELNFMFLYLQRHLQDRHGLVVRRGDTAILTKPLMEKIEAEIRAADLIIGDITYSSPNVFYELGLARAFGKPIIFLTQEDPKLAPVDLHHFDFIHYELNRDQDFLSKLDRAVQSVFSADYSALYEQAQALLKEFNVQTGGAHLPSSLEEFRARVVRGERLEGIPQAQEQGFAEFLLPKVVADATDIAVIRRIDQWLSKLATASPLSPSDASKRKRSRPERTKRHRD